LKPVDKHRPPAKHRTWTGANPGGSLAADHVRPASVVTKATDGAAGRTLRATITHNGTAVHDTLVAP
jgi:hypothetical protein